MRNQHSLDQARKLAETALALMIKQGVSPTPENYQIWYAFALGENKDLVKRVEDATSKGKVKETAEAIHEEFFNNQDSAHAMEAVSREMDAAMERVTESLRSAGKNTTEYGAALSGVSGQLGAINDPKAMKAVIDQLLAATQNMEQHSQELENRLQQSTQEVSKLRENLETIRTESLTDQLTGLSNRRAFDTSLKNLSHEVREKNEPMCLLIGDIDKFKAFNDTWGHQTGDQVLKLVAHCLKESVRQEDMPARYGGEEFAVILPYTSLEGALTVAEDIRQLVESKKVVKRSTGESLGTITLSIGAAELRPGEGLSDLIERADACLYAAKNAGRNRVMGEVEHAASNAA